MKIKIHNWNTFRHGVWWKLKWNREYPKTQLVQQKGLIQSISSVTIVGELDKESQKVSCCEPAVPQNRLSNILEEIRNKIQENNRASIWKTVSIKCNFSLFLRSKPLFLPIISLHRSCFKLQSSLKLLKETLAKIPQNSLSLLYFQQKLERNFIGFVGWSKLSLN